MGIPPKPLPHGKPFSPAGPSASPLSGARQSSAPPVYRPQTVVKIVQAKGVRGSFGLETRPAPPAYRPEQDIKPPVQRKSANNFKVESRPAPPVYRSQQTNNNWEVQLKPASNFMFERRPAPLVYRPQQSAICGVQQRTASPNGMKSAPMASIVFTSLSLGIVQRAGAAAAPPAAAGGAAVAPPVVVAPVVAAAPPAPVAPAGPTVEYTDHWLHYHHEDSQQIVENNDDDIAHDIWTQIPADTADDTKVIVNYDKGSGHVRYLVVVAFYRDDGRIRFHSARRAETRGVAFGTDIRCNINWNWGG